MRLTSRQAFDAWQEDGGDLATYNRAQFMSADFGCMELDPPDG
jgi:hypothetical protein